MPTVHLTLMRTPRREDPRVKKNRSWRKHHQRARNRWEPRVGLRARDRRALIATQQEVHA